MDGVIESKERKRCRRGRLCREEEEKYLKCVNLPFFVPFFFDTTHASTCSRNVSAPNLFHFHEVFIDRWSLKVNIGKNGHQDAEFMVAKERELSAAATRVPGYRHRSRRHRRHRRHSNHRGCHRLRCGRLRISACTLDR